MMERLKDFYAYFCAVALAAVVALCAFPASAADKATLRLDWVNSGYHADLVLRARQGHFSESGHRSRSPRRQRIGGHGPDSRQRFGDVWHRGYGCGHGLHRAGHADKDRIRLSSAECARHSFPGGERLEAICRHGQRQDRLLTGWCIVADPSGVDQTGRPGRQSSAHQHGACRKDDLYPDPSCGRYRTHLVSS